MKSIHVFKIDQAAALKACPYLPNAFMFAARLHVASVPITASGTERQKSMFRPRQVRCWHEASISDDHPEFRCWSESRRFLEIVTGAKLTQSRRSEVSTSPSEGQRIIMVRTFRNKGRRRHFKLNTVRSKSLTATCVARVAASS